jgi:hypothetical protein
MQKEDEGIPWVISQAPYAENFCTQDEMNNIIIPYRNYVNTITGIQSSSVTEISNTELKIVYTFDTLENTYLALSLMRQSDSNNKISYDRQQLIVQKRLDSNVKHNISYAIVNNLTSYLE